MTEITTGMKVEAIKTHCIGLLIETIKYTGTVSKVNEKSFIVNFDHMTKTFGQKTEIDNIQYTGSTKFTYWKTRKSNGNRIYKSQLNGIVEL